MKAETKVVYVSYDGAAEPLGVSQIVPYLERLANDFGVTLISFEKPGTDREYVSERLRAAGVVWKPLDYHLNPKVVSTALDVRRGARAIDEAWPGEGADIIHVRSYVPALMALRSKRLRQAKLLFDIRGFWADERLEGGIWSNGPLYRLAKRYEKSFFERADCVVTLTEASVPSIKAMLGSRDIPVAVIPTCVDLDRFRPASRASGGPTALWSGSIGTWYRLDLAAEAARAMELPLRVVTRDTDQARSILAGSSAAVGTASPSEMPDQLAQAHVGLCLIEPSFSKIASAPTRLAEHLACGSPVLVSRGVGDMAAIVEEDGVGAAYEDGRDLPDAARAARKLLESDGIQERCRACAERRFDAGTGASRYAELYRSLT